MKRTTSAAAPSHDHMLVELGPALVTYHQRHGHIADCDRRFSAWKAKTLNAFDPRVTEIEAQKGELVGELVQLVKAEKLLSFGDSAMVDHNLALALRCGVEHRLVPGATALQTALAAIAEGEQCTLAELLATISARIASVRRAAMSASASDAAIDDAWFMRCALLLVAERKEFGDSDGDGRVVVWEIREPELLGFPSQCAALHEKRRALQEHIVACNGVLELLRKSAAQRAASANEIAKRSVCLCWYDVRRAHEKKAERERARLEKKKKKKASDAKAKASEDRHGTAERHGHRR